MAGDYTADFPVVYCKSQKRSKGNGRADWNPIQEGGGGGGAGHLEQWSGQAGKGRSVTVIW